MSLRGTTGSDASSASESGVDTITDEEEELDKSEEDMFA